ncbi:MAG: phage holin [Eubacteriales bacterium]|jgi:SPP1 family holin
MDKKIKISAGTIARTAVLALALINQVLVILGRPVIEIADEQVTQFVTVGFTVASAVISWWYNNSFTAAARAGDKLMYEIKERAGE